MTSDLKNPAVTMARIGEQLKEARGKRSVTIDQVQKQTRIHSTVLKALEEGRCDEMLTPTYVRSFLKKYAEFLGLDARQMLAEYARLHPAPAGVQMAISSRTASPPSFDISKFLPAARKAATVIIIAALAIFLGGKAAGLFRHWREAATAKPKVIRTAPLKKKAVIQPAAVRKEPSAKEAVSKAQPAVKPAVVQARPAETEKKKQAPIPKDVPLKLMLRANQTVLVKVKTDGNLLFSRVLERGTVESFTAEDRINIYVAKAEAIELFLNGRGIGSPGKGLLKDIEITRSGLKIR